MPGLIDRSLVAHRLQSQLAALDAIRLRRRERMLATREQILAMGFDTRFLRMWEFYLAYCEAGFRSGSTDVAQLTLERR